MQETRRLMIAMYQQHIYTEYLPKIIGQRKMAEFDLNPSGLKSELIDTFAFSDKKTSENV